MEYVRTIIRQSRDQFNALLSQQDRKWMLLYVSCVIIVTILCRIARNQTYDKTRIWRQEVSALKPYLQPDPLHDFEYYPCFPGLTPSSSLQRQGTCVRILSRSNFRISATMAESCKYLQIGEKTPICSYKPVVNDTSDYYSKEGLEEKDLVEDMLKVINSDPDMTFFDVGTDVGVYCIAAAKVNNNTVCLDANYNHLRQITRSLFLGNIITNALMVWNKLSNKHETVRFRIPAYQGALSMSEQVPDFQTLHNQKGTVLFVNTITLNDLRGAFGDKPVFMKLDVGGNEEVILENSNFFFKRTDVRVIQLKLDDGESRDGLIRFLKRYGFHPFADALGKQPLVQGDKLTKWPRNVYFIKTMKMLNFL